MKKLCIILIILFCFASAGTATYITKVYKDSGGDRLVVASGGTLLVESGGTLTIEDGSLAAGDIALADTKLIVGAATGFGAAKSMSGDATIANTGALTIATGAVEDSMIEGLADEYFIVGTDGTAANNAKVTMSGDVTMDNTGVVDVAATFVQNVRDRVTIAELIAGKTLVTAIAAKRFRLTDVFLLPYGGDCDNSTTVDIIGTQSGSTALVKFTTTALDDDTLIRMGDANTTPLINGLGLVSNDVNTAISIASVGTNIETCEGVDVILNYVTE